jgi:hypothetical protein
VDPNPKESVSFGRLKCWIRIQTRVVDEISRSRNFAKYLFRISRNNFFLFAKFREILRNFAKYREIFVTKLKFSQGKIHFLNFIAFQYHQKDDFYVKNP